MCYFDSCLQAPALSYWQTSSWSAPTFVCSLEIARRLGGAWSPRHSERGTILACGLPNRLAVDPFRSPWISAFSPQASFLRFRCFGHYDWNAFVCCCVNWDYSSLFGLVHYWCQLLVHSSALFCAEYSLDKRAHTNNWDLAPSSLYNIRPSREGFLCFHFC